MQSELSLLASIVTQTDIRGEQASARTAIDQGIRAALLCTLFGVEREDWVWPFRQSWQSTSPMQPTPAANAQASASRRAAAHMLGGLLEPLGRIGHLGTLAGASDLDPMDPGPSHTVLAATLAACVACSQLGETHAGGDDHGKGNDTDVPIGSAVLAGVESAWRLRAAITGTRPGVGFHSPGVFGTLAAAAAGARILGLAPDACAGALAIALTRAAGLGINSAASMIGMTHFGWGALHGLEAALLAAQGWDASRDLQRALATLFGEEPARAAIRNLAEPGTRAADALVFKRYPCNIYLNLLVTMLEEVIQDGPVDRIEISMPWVPHLDCAEPKDLRQARNSAQAVAAIAGAGDISYAAFSGPPGPWVPTPGVARLLPKVSLHMDKDAPTGLRKAMIGVRAWRGEALVQEAQRSMQSLQGWGAEHARKLMGPSDPHGGVAALYEGSYLRGFAHVKARLASVAL